jgi:hypothetical protein
VTKRVGGLNSNSYEQYNCIRLALGNRDVVARGCSSLLLRRREGQRWAIEATITDIVGSQGDRVTSSPASGVGTPSTLPAAGLVRPSFQYIVIWYHVRNRLTAPLSPLEGAERDAALPYPIFLHYYVTTSARRPFYFTNYRKRAFLLMIAVMGRQEGSSLPEESPKII